MHEKVKLFTQSRAYDVVIASEVDMVPYLRIAQHPCSILEDLELSSLHDRVFKSEPGYRKTRAGLTWWKLSNYVRSFSRFIQACTVVSENEKQLVRDLLKNSLPVEIIPNGIDTEFYTGDYGILEPDSLVYSGALTYGANFDAMLYFLTDIYPLIQKEVPQVKLYVTGKVNDVPLERLPRLPGVIFTGYLPDIRPRVAQSWVSVVPLRVGGGTRLKILESLALGTPVVSTSKGAEGLELIPGSDLFIADQPAEFAQKVISILRDRNMRDRIGTQGRDTVNERYSWAGIGAKFNQFIEEIVHITTGAREYGAH
jgi:glycosyltransferase involved in cell wall biosynthesis